MSGWLARLLRPEERAARTPYGRVRYLARDVWHGRALRAYGEWSAAEVALWRRLVRPGQTVVDAGAHVGCHALALAALVGPLGLVHAFEPQARVADLLARNVAANRLGGRVLVYRNALGATPGTAALATPDYGRAGNFGGVALGAAGDAPVAVTTLDVALRGAAVAFVKVDVEGMEADVLDGGRATIARCRPVLYVENDRADRSAALLRLLRDLGYDARWHLPPLFNPQNHRGRRVDIFPGVVSVNVLALPDDRWPRSWPADPHLHPLERVRLTPDGRIAWAPAR